MEPATPTSPTPRPDSSPPPVSNRNDSTVCPGRTALRLSGLGAGEVGLGILLALSLAVFGVGCFLFWNYTVDDAYITLRYARNLVEGWGFVYNPGGDVVEGYSNPTLLFAQALFLALGLDGIAWTKYLGVASGAGMLLVVAGMALDLLRWTIPDGGTRRSILPAAALGTGWLALSPTLSTISVMGLEGSLFGFLIALGAWMTLRTLQAEGGRWPAVLGGIALGLSTWTRPEGVAFALGWSLAAVAFARLDRRSLKRPLLLAGVALGAWLALVAFRLIVFGDIQPNTYYAKMGGDPGSRWIEGWRYVGVWHVAGAGIAWWILGIVAWFLAPRSARRPALLLLLASLGTFLVVAYMGGDWMPHLRLIGPGLGPLAALTGAGLGLLLTRLPFHPARVRAFLSTAIAILLSLGFLKLEYRSILNAMSEGQIRTWGWNDSQRPLGEWLGEWNARRGGDLRVAIEDIGLVGWYSRAEILDLAGLVDPVWAHLRHREGTNARYPTRRLLREFRPHAVVLISTRRDTAGRYITTWDVDRAILDDPEFRASYREKVRFTHKDYPGDGYFLHVFLRNDVFDQPPDVTPPPPRAVSAPAQSP